jgi:DNA-binding response OmpR family regulator
MINKVKSILVIDDDREDYELIVDAIKEFDSAISVSFLDNCKNAVQYKDQNFDLVFLDINMPEHDGFVWLKGIREKGYNDLPIIMYTNSLRPEHIMQAYKQGANLYYAKPTSFIELINGLKKLTSLDWTNPFSITKNYYHNEQYSVFNIA